MALRSRQTHHSEGPAIVAVDIAPFEDNDLEDPDRDRYDNLDDVDDQFVEGDLFMVEFEAHVGGSSPVTCYSCRWSSVSAREYSILCAQWQLCRVAVAWWWLVSVGRGTRTTAGGLDEPSAVVNPGGANSFENAVQWFARLSTWQGPRSSCKSRRKEWRTGDAICRCDAVVERKQAGDLVNECPRLSGRVVLFQADVEEENGGRMGSTGRKGASKVKEAEKEGAGKCREGMEKEAS